MHFDASSGQWHHQMVSVLSSASNGSYVGLNSTTPIDKFMCRRSSGWSLLADNGYFSWCFLDNYLTLLPDLIFFLLAVASTAVLFSKKRRSSWTWDFITKLVLLPLQFIVTAIISTIRFGGVSSFEDRLPAFTSFAVLFGVSFLHYAENGVLKIPSAVLLWYWLITVISAVLRLVGAVVDGSDLALTIAYSFLVSNSLLIFLLEWLVPKLNTRGEEPCFDNSDAFARLFITWVNPLIATACSRVLVEKDLPKPEDGFTSTELSDRLYAYWEGSKRRDAYGFGWCLVKMLRFDMTALIASSALHDLSGYLQPFVLRYLIAFVASQTTSHPQPIYNGVYISLLVFAVSFGGSLLMNITRMTMVKVMLALEGSIYGAVFRKALKLSPKARETRTASKIMNLMTVDVGEVQFTFNMLTTVITAPFQLVFCIYSLWAFMGWSFLGGMSFLVIVVPINAVLSQRLNNYYREVMDAKDERTKFTNSLFSNAKSLKLYAWERPFLARLSKIRNDKELAVSRKFRLVDTCFEAIWGLAPYLTAASVFACFLIFEKRPLTAEIVFPSMILFNLMTEPMTIIPFAITSLIQSKVSFDRFADLLDAEEYSSVGITRDPGSVVPHGEPTVTLSKSTLLWNEGEDAIVALENIDFTALKGELACIIGKVGAGKSAMLRSICGELYLKEGTLSTVGNIAYVPQEPWLLNQTVKENILFRNRYDPVFYQMTLEACDLLHDIESFPDGDETEIGERGVSLSGGQKARVSLARAVYARADIYIMDDVLSAVDEHVGRHLIDRVLGKGGLLASKTLILATNNIRVLAEADQILLLENKTITERGTPSDAVAAQKAIYALMKEFGSSQNDDFEEIKGEIVHPHQRRDSVSSLRRASIDSIVSLPDEATKEIKRTQKPGEQQKIGGVKRDVFLRYFRAGGIVWVIVSVAALVCTNALGAVGSIWLKLWADKNEDGSTDNPVFYLSWFVIIGVLYSILNVISAYLILVVYGLRAGQVLHDLMAKSVLRSPMSFFETTPLGQVLNRFTKDINDLDDALPWTWLNFCSMISKLFFSLLIMFYATPYVIAATIPVSVLFLYYQRLYLGSSRQLKRFSSSARSPMLSHYEESLRGINVVRAYGKGDRFTIENDNRSSLVLRCSYNSQSVDRWLSLRLQFLSGTVTLLAALSSVYMTTTGHMSSGMVGLVMANAVSITSFMSGIVQQTVFMEQRGVAMERLLEYCDLPPEAPEIVEGNRPPAHWPHEGAVKLEGLSTRYRDNLDLVLKNVSLQIKPTEKIGIVGRTGAGKSTLTLSLFRIIEPAAGNIIIDGIDTSKIGVLDLRRNLSIIPQDAQIFSGTVRDNLDPLDEHDDTELWRVLELCHLKKHIEGMGDGLASILTSGGDNLSKGQAQLICLGRALLHTANILVLDEATASVDVETDKIIQETIRTEFKHKTIITIAHRLNTVMDSDKIVVLEKGELVEFDTPQALLANPESLFYGLCEKGGFISSQRTSAQPSTQTSRQPSPEPK